MLYCTKCGHQLTTATKFCPACGAAQPASAPQSTTTNTTQPTAAPTQTAASQPAPPLKVAQNRWQAWQDATEAETAQGPLSFIDSTKYGISHWRDFKTAESRRGVFWWLTLGITVLGIGVEIVFLILTSVFGALGALGSLLVVVLIFILVAASLVAEVALLSAIARRLIYLGKNPWLCLLSLVIFANLYIFYLLIITNPTTNRAA
ncbi:hypothetical protein LFAB_06335 [Lactiplantibacillus fabifermentans T30PCM01]|uniref:Zinc-ribbon domain-containing protein n=1 Tax=Lactiplantibacillus fabifermentans T30PCM01 TaxID=1400520 RepID=W6T9P9_9LACO|nr:zinc-ribbon domain-containing protein [Lactiplantibacillus fabifermentans]ETY74603.1 hypothetical protein LFAB_06335 [Lactiplantibacillus fabifermentans T30PCM01]